MHQYLLKKYDKKEMLPLFSRELGIREMRAQLPASSIMGGGTL